MALQYGMNITASDMRSLLEKNDKQQSGVRTWRQLFGNASLGFNAQSDAITTDYSDAIAKAYKANFEQNNAIMGAGLSTGVTREMLSQSRNDLHTAYETYVRNYGSDVATAAETYGEEVGAIDTALTERATNFSNLYNSAYKYLSEELFGSYMTLPGTAENGAEAIYEGEGKDSEFKGYQDVNVDYMTDHGLGWLTDGDGNLLSWNEMSQKMFNADGSLNRYGVMFFDQMFNTLPENYMTTEGERMRGFDEWLSETDSELRDWWVGQDVFNYNFAGTNKGTSQVMTGRESTDDKYGAYEYADTHGMSEFAKFDFGESSEAFQKAVEKLAFADEWCNETAPKLNQMEMMTASMYQGTDQVYIPTYYDPQEYYPEARDAWNAYQSTANELTGQLDTFFKGKMGSEMYTQFREENKALYDEYTKLMEQAKSSEYYNKDVANSINKWYNNLLKQMNAYIKKHGYTGKTSGF